MNWKVKFELNAEEFLIACLLKLLEQKEYAKNSTQVRADLKVILKAFGLATHHTDILHHFDNMYLLFIRTLYQIKE